MCKRKKKIKAKDIENILEVYAKENKGKYGSDEQMIGDLRTYFDKVGIPRIPANDKKEKKE